jgi:hypothetical protein
MHDHIRDRTDEGVDRELDIIMAGSRVLPLSIHGYGETRYNCRLQGKGQSSADAWGR